MQYPPLPESRLARLRLALKPIGIVIWALGPFRIHRNGGGFSAVFRWYHPLNWIIAPFVLIWCGINGEKFSDVMPFRLSKWWREPENRKTLEWL